MLQLPAGRDLHYRSGVNALGEAIRREREARNWTQTDLAVRAQISARYVSSIENGQNVSTDILQRLASAMSLASLPLDGLTLTGPPPLPIPSPYDRDPSIRLLVDTLVALQPGERLRFGELLQLFAAALASTPSGDDLHAARPRAADDELRDLIDTGDDDDSRGGRGGYGQPQTPHGRPARGAAR